MRDSNVGKQEQAVAMSGVKNGVGDGNKEAHINSMCRYACDY